MNIDLHKHVVPPTVLDAIRKSPERFQTSVYQEECVYVLSGRGAAVIGDQTHKIGPGDFMAHPIDNIAHEMINDGAEPLVCLVIGQRLAQDITDYPRQGKRLFRHSGARSLVDIADIRKA